VAGCRKNPTSPSRVVIATTQEPDALLPWFAESVAAHQVTEAVSRSLTQYDRQWRLVPALATSLPSLANGSVVPLDEAGRPVADPARAAKMRVTWKLRPEAAWADGTPVTAADFLFAHDVLMDPTQEVRDRSKAQKVERMEAPDPHTLVVTWREPYAFFAAYRNHPLLPAHAMASSFRPDGGRTRNLKESPFLRAPLGFGPFRVAEWKPGQFIRLLKNPHAYAPPRLEEVVWQFVPSDVGAVAKLEAGEVDAIAPDGSVGVDLLEDLARRRPGEFVVDVQPGMLWAHLDVNLGDPWLKDRRVRQALAHALSREGAVRAVFKGRYQVSHALFPPLHQGHAEGLPTYPHDVERANLLLDQAGLARGPNGMRADAAGTPVELHVAYATGVKTTEDLLQVFQQDLRGVGISLRLMGYPVKVFFGDVLKNRKARHLAFYAWSLDPMSYGETLLASTAIPSEDNGWVGQNYPGYVNPVADDLIARVPRTLEPAPRRELLQRINRLVAEDLPMVPVYYRPVVSVTRRGLEQWAPTGTPTSVSWNCEGWALPAAP
jgi:peptide/nickel transport system substrate-binding protein